jgi:hypothetical protein
MTRLRMEDLPSAVQQKVQKQLQDQSGVPATNTKIQAAKQQYQKAAEVVAEVRTKPHHVRAMLILVAILAYVLMGIGWIIGAIGDSFYEVGKRMHDAKWEIE